MNPAGAGAEKNTNAATWKGISKRTGERRRPAGDIPEVSAFPLAAGNDSSEYRVQSSEGEKPFRVSGWKIEAGYRIQEDLSEPQTSNFKLQTANCFPTFTSSRYTHSTL
jgi:hypothetical protein